jgi:putative peptide zinc metalloprotease protein
MYSRDSIVAVHPFTRQREGEEIVIGNPDTGVFLAVPPEAVDVIDLLATGKSVGEVSDLHFQKTGETPDLEDLLNHLESRGLIAPQVTVKDKVQSGTTIPAIRFHFSRFPQSLARLLFSYPLLALSAALVGLALAAVFNDHALTPVPADLVFPDHIALSWAVFTVIGYGAIFLHELAHLIGARSLAINSRMRISHRLWYIVAETDLTGLWSVPRRQRYLPLLAGMIVDATGAACIVLCLFGIHSHLFSFSPFTLRLLRALAFANIMRIFWEFFLFVRTDLYYVAATLLNCKNLLVDTNTFLRNQLARLTSLVQPVDQLGIPATERRAIRLYAPFLVAGRTWAVFTLVWVTFPVLAGYWNSLMPVVRAGYSAGHSEFVDALVVATLLFVPTIAGFVFWAGTLVRRKGV